MRQAEDDYARDQGLCPPGAGGGGGDRASRGSVPHLTITHVRSFGGSRDAGDRRISLEAGDWYADMAKLECVCTEALANGLVRVVEVAARTGEPGDGIIYVTPVEAAVKIRTGAEGREALA